MTLSRRSFLVSSAAAILAPALPSLTTAAPVTVGVDLAAKPDLLAFVIGTPGEYDWQTCFASTAEEAFEEWVWQSVHEPGDVSFDPDYVRRIPEWDGRDPQTITGVDWFDANMGYCCGRCGYETHPELGGRAVRGEVLCEECLTLADRLAGAPDEVVEDLAERIACDGEDVARAWVARQRVDLPAAIWERALAEAHA